MARYPGAVWKPLPEAGAPDGYRKDKFIVHSTGSNGTARGTWEYFAQSGVVNESTFIVGTGPDDPTLQIMDSTDNADANVAANQSGISVEVVGDGYGGYNAHQRSELIGLGIWARREHPLILAQIIPSPSGRGFGWHIMFGAPGPWTTVNKICPGPIRIQELKSDIFPAIFAGQTPGGGFMADLTEPEQREVLSGARAIKDRGGEVYNFIHAIPSRTAALVLASLGSAVDVDEAALAKSLAPLITQATPTLSDADLQRVAKAVADEQARRQAD